MEPMPEPSITDKKLYSYYKKQGCSPIWAEGILGWNYHCGCEGLNHAVDSQCSVLE